VSRFLWCSLWSLALIVLTVFPVWSDGGGAKEVWAEETRTKEAPIGRLRVAVSIPPQKYFVERIGGELVEVTTMVPPGADPHTYEPRPSRMASLSGAMLYFSMGMEFESVWLARFRNVSKGMKVIPMHEGLERMAMADDAHGHDQDEEEGHADEGHAEEGHGVGLPDPHVWLSPPLVRVMAFNILEALVREDPENAGEYRKNYAAFCQEVSKLDAGILEFLALNDVLGREFLVFHPSFGYFARHYGLQQTVIEAGGKEPGPAELVGLIEHVRERGLKTVFVEPQFSEKSARVVARAINGSVVQLNPLAADWADNMWVVVRAVTAGAK
jgi:zinc transport system substrate-binding protein